MKSLTARTRQFSQRYRVLAGLGLHDPKVSGAQRKALAAVRRGLDRG